MADNGTMDRWLEASEQYLQRFGDIFPLMQFWGGLEDAVEEIDRCLASGKPYKPEDGLIY